MTMMRMRMLVGMRSKTVVVKMRVMSMIMKMVITMVMATMKKRS